MYSYFLTLSYMAEVTVAKIREQNKLRARKYYEKHREEIAKRRKESRGEPIIKTKIVETLVYPRKDEINKLTENIKNLKQEIEVIRKTKSKDASPSTEPPRIYKFDKDSLIELVKEKVEKPRSRKNYINNINHLFDILFCDDLQVELRKYKSVVQRIQHASLKNDETSGYSVNSLKGFFQTILKLVTLTNMELPKKALEAYNYEFEAYKLLSREQTKKKQEEVELMDFKDYLKKIKDHYGPNKTNPKISKQYMIVYFYKINTFRDDLGHVLIIDKKLEPKEMNEETNYLYVPKSVKKNGRAMYPNLTFFLNNYKTKGIYGADEIKINSTDSKVVRKYINENNLVANDYIFDNESLSKYISKMNKQVEGCEGITINTIRHMKISSALDTDEAVSNPAIRIKVAKEAHHNPNTSVATYRHRKVKKSSS